MNMLIRRVFAIGCILTAILCPVSVWQLYAADGAAEENRIVSSVAKEIQGEVVWKTKTKLAVVYYSDGQSEQEMLFLLDGPVKVVHRLSLDDIQVGDTVRVSYEEILEERAGGAVTKTRPLAVTFIRSGTRTAPVSAGESAGTESDILSNE